MERFVVVGLRAPGAMIFRRWGEFRDDGVQYARYPADLCVSARVLDCVRDLVVHSPVTSLSLSLSRCSFPSPFLARSRSTYLSPSYFDVILPCYYLDHRSRLAVREVAEKRDRDEPRSRKEVPRTCKKVNAVAPFCIDYVINTPFNYFDK